MRRCAGALYCSCFLEAASLHSSIILVRQTSLSSTSLSLSAPVVEWGGMELPPSWGQNDPNSEAVPFNDPNSEAVPFRPIPQPVLRGWVSHTRITHTNTCLAETSGGGGGGSGGSGRGTHTPIPKPTCPCTNLPLHPPTQRHTPTHPFTHPSLHLPTHPPTHPPVYPHTQSHTYIHTYPYMSHTNKRPIPTLTHPPTHP